MSDISELYNKDPEVDISGTSEEINFKLSPRLIPKDFHASVETPKPHKPKPSKIHAREAVKKNKNLSKCFSILQKTNLCFENVISTVRCYRPELGSNLEKIYATYNKLFEAVLENAVSMITSKDFEINNMQKKHDDFIGTEIEAREGIQSKFSKQKELIQILKTRLKISTTAEEALQLEIKELREILKSDQTAFWEANEGHTWIKSAKEESLTLQAMP